MTYEEASSILFSIFHECTDDNSIIEETFGEISSRVYPENSTETEEPKAMNSNKYKNINVDSFFTGTALERVALNGRVCYKGETMYYGIDYGHTYIAIEGEEDEIVAQSGLLRDDIDIWGLDPDHNYTEEELVALVRPSILKYCD